MANTKSTAVTNQEAGTRLQPNVMTASHQIAIVHVACGALAANETVEFLRLPSSARLLDLEVVNDDLGTTLTIDFGLGTPNDGAAPTPVDADCLADGYTAQTAAAVWTHILGLGTNGPPPEEMDDNRLWELAGLSADPGGEMVIYGTCATSGTPAAGDVTLKITWASEMGAS